jgi:hypothetical protein
LRKISCSKAPASDNKAPTTKADKARGKRNCQKISGASEGIKQPVSPHTTVRSMKAGATINSNSNAGFARVIELPLWFT